MLKKFLSGSGIFALSVLAFSVVRQIIVFPAISRIDDQLFASLTFMVFTFEAIAYGFAGAIPDYYVRQLQGGGTVNAGLMRQLGRLCLLGLASIPAFLLLGMDAWTSLLLGLYLYFFALNALKIKLVFNKLHFGENFIYMAFRSVPYLLALWLIWVQPAWLHGYELQAVAALMLAFEFFYWLRLNAITREDMRESRQGEGAEQEYGALLASLLPFIASALLIGVIQRGDLTLVKLADAAYYTDYAKMILTINFFCAPLSLMISAPLLSFLSRHALSLDSPEIRRLLLVISGLVLLTGLGAMLAFGYVNDILYGSSSESPAWLVFFLTVSTLLYALVRTMVVKFSAVRFTLLVNICLVMLSVLMVIYLPALIFVIAFYALRLLTYVALLAAGIFSSKHNQSI